MDGQAPPFSLPRIDTEAEAGLQDFLRDGPVVLVFAHADCPTTLLALRRLAPAGGERSWWSRRRRCRTPPGWPGAPV